MKAWPLASSLLLLVACSSACSGESEPRCDLIGSCDPGLHVDGTVALSVTELDGAELEICQGAACKKTLLADESPRLMCASTSFMCDSTADGASTRLAITVPMTSAEAIDDAVYTVRISSKTGNVLLQAAKPVRFTRDTTCGECIRGELAVP